MKGYNTSNGYMGYVEANTFYLPVNRNILSLCTTGVISMLYLSWY